MKKNTTILIKIFFIFFILNLSFGKNRIPELNDSMYTQKFNDNLKIILKFEGGFTDLLDDPGGSTNYGITQCTYNAYRLNNLKLKTKPVKKITKEEVKHCYFIRYWKPSKSDSLPLLVGVVHFDASVNFGIAGANKLLFRTLGIKKFTSSTKEMIDTMDEKELAYKYIDVRMQKRYEIVEKKPKSKRFLRGWLNRDKKLKKILEQYQK